MVEASTVEEKTRVVKEAWSTGRLIDELFLELDNVREIDEKSGTTKRKYEEQAKWLIYRIPVYRPAPAFVINLSDLSTTDQGRTSRFERYYPGLCVERDYR